MLPHVVLTQVSGFTAAQPPLTAKRGHCCRCQVIGQRLQWKLDSRDRTFDELDLL